MKVERVVYPCLSKKIIWYAINTKQLISIT